MKKEDVVLWDWNRILFGETPPIFILEVFLRTIVAFALLLVVLRLLGKKMNGQLNLTENSVMITLGAIISVPMQMPDRGIVLGIVALLCIVMLQRAINWWASKDGKVEKITQGTLSVLVKDGVMDLKMMQHLGVSKQDLFSALREQEYHNLAKAKRVYFEACGMLNVYEEHERRPGLAIYPSDQNEMLEHSEKDEAHVTCKNCGFVASKDNHSERCPHCDASQWMPAIY
jgi:uncharacterized membrane protein YcaP (DUF421 family)